jgi:hypothetical protein
MNVTEKQLLIINKTARNLAPFFVFSYYDKEDIEQEIRITCLKVLPDYDETKSDLYTFLFMNARNALMDMRRLKLSRTVIPCRFDSEGKCIEHENEEGCRLYRRRNHDNGRKRSIAEPQSLSDEQLSITYDLGASLDNQYIFAIIDKEIPAKIRRDYLIYLEGGTLAYYNKLVVLQHIRAIAKKHGFIEE